MRPVSSRENEGRGEMKKEKWTCWIDEEKKAEGAVVGTRKAVLDWMKKTYPGLRKARDGEMVPAWYFFWENDVEHYRSAKGEDLYLVRGPAEEERKAPTAEEEKRLEKALRSHRGNRIKYDREGFEAERKDEGERQEEGRFRMTRLQTRLPRPYWRRRVCRQGNRGRNWSRSRVGIMFSPGCFATTTCGLSSTL